MGDLEIKIFTQKLRKNPIKFYLLLIFLFKVLSDFVRRKFIKKKSVAYNVPDFNDTFDFRYESLAFINDEIDTQPKFHFSTNEIVAVGDEQYEHYFSRLYFLIFSKQKNLYSDIEFLRVWMNDHPIGQSIPWHPYNVSERIVNLSIFFSRFNSFFNENQNQMILTWLFKHGEFLFQNFEEHLGKHNHLINNSRALLYVSVIFKSEEFSLKWKEKSFNTLKVQMPWQVLADGAHSEQSSTYHLLITRTLWELRELFSQLNEKFEFDPVLNDMLTYANFLILQDGKIPMLGHITPDIHWKELVGLHALWFSNSKIKQSAYSSLFKSKRKIELSAENRNCRVFSNSGLGVLMHDEISIFLSNKLSGRVECHGDQNALGIDIFWSGTHLVRDCGLNSYDLNNNRTWFESWEGQSTISINKINPLVIDWRRRQLPASYISNGASIQLKNLNSVIGEHAFYERLPNPAIVSRQVNIENDQIQIIDTIKSKGYNKYNAVFHFGSCQIKSTENSVFISDIVDKNTFVFYFPDAVSAEIRECQYSNEYGKIERGTSLFICADIVHENTVFSYEIEKSNQCAE